MEVFVSYFYSNGLIGSGYGRNALKLDKPVSGLEIIEEIEAKLREVLKYKNVVVFAWQRFEEEK